MASVADTVFVNSRNQKVVWAQFKPKGDPVALYYFHLGYQDCILYNNDYYENLQNRGIWVFSFDPHGQGRSEPKAPNNLFVNKYQDLVDDSLQFFNDIVLKEYKESQYYKKIPLVIGGESMGGLVQSLTALKVQDQINGLVLMAPAIGVQMDLYHSFMLKISGLLDKLVPKLRAVTVASPEAAFRDQSQIERIKKDPTFDAGNMRVHTALQIVEGMRYLEKREHELNVPLLILFGENDKVCDPKYARRFFEKNQNPEKQFITIKEAWHALVAHPDSKESTRETFVWI